jgi:hypothetical protein
MIKNQPVSIEQVIYKQAHESAKQRKGRKNACQCIRSSDMITLRNWSFRYLCQRSKQREKCV